MTTVEQSSKAAMAPDLIKETTTQTFMKDVIEESKRQPVLIDFWAEWCGPCRQLTPVLEKSVRNAKGKVKLVKMNIDQHPAIPGQMGIQSIPAVIAFANGQPVDGFMGAVPESQVNAFIEKLTRGDTAPSESNITEILQEAKAALAEGDAVTAAHVYTEVLSLDATNIAALAGLAKCYVTTGAIEQARQTLARVPESRRNDAAVKVVQASIDARAPGPQHISVEENGATSLAEPHIFPVPPGKRNRRDTDTQPVSAKLSDFVFISHAHKDRKMAREIVGRLEQHGIRCWIAPRNLRPGRPHDDEIVEAIESCKAVVLIFSDVCNESDYVRSEVSVAGDAKRLIIPFRIEDTKPKGGLRMRIAHLHWLDAFEDREDAIGMLISQLEKVSTQ